MTVKVVMTVMTDDDSSHSVDDNANNSDDSMITVDLY